MIGIDRFQTILARFPAAAVAIYLALIVLFVFTLSDRVIEVLEQRAAVASVSDILERMEAQNPLRSRTAVSDVSVQTGSPFLEGTSASVAGAALLQRVTAATSRMRGNTLSSQVDLRGSQSKTGFITVTSSLEIEPAYLQQLLYDLEAGMPYLFIDQLVVQGSAEGGKLRVLFAVSGQWQGGTKKQ